MNGINNSLLVGQEAAGHQQEAAVLLLQTPPQKSPAEAADPRCCPWNWRKRSLPGRWERYRTVSRQQGLPVPLFKSGNQTDGKPSPAFPLPPESRHKRPLDGSQAPGLCSAQGARGRAACLALQGMRTKHLPEGHARLQCLITAEAYLGPRLLPLPCSAHHPAPAGAHSATQGHSTRGGRWEGKAQDHALKPGVLCSSPVLPLPCSSDTIHGTPQPPDHKPPKPALHRAPNRQP